MTQPTRSLLLLLPILISLTVSHSIEHTISKQEGLRGRRRRVHNGRSELVRNLGDELTAGGGGNSQGQMNGYMWMRQMDCNSLVIPIEGGRPGRGGRNETFVPRPCQGETSETEAPSWTPPAGLLPQTESPIDGAGSPEYLTTVPTTIAPTTIPPQPPPPPLSVDVSVSVALSRRASDPMEDVERAVVQVLATIIEMYLPYSVPHRRLQRSSVELIHSGTTAALVEEDRLQATWWSFTVEYILMQDGEPFYFPGPMALNALQRTLEALIGGTIASGHFFQYLSQHVDDLLAVSVPGMESEDNFHAEATAGGGSGERGEVGLSAGKTVFAPGGTYSAELQVEEWDRRRWFGVALFCATTVLTLLLMFVAARRRRRRTDQELWGIPPFTENGVGELLNVGWKLQGEVMQVYDKRNVGYRDDDSMLIGGFEQREAWSPSTASMGT